MNITRILLLRAFLLITLLILLVCLRSRTPREPHSPNRDRRRNALRASWGPRDTAPREVRPVAHWLALWACTPPGASSCGRSGPLLVCVGGAGLTRAVERRASQALPDLHEGSPVSESDEVLANDRFAPLSERRSRAVTGPAPKTSPPRHASTPGSSYC